MIKTPFDLMTILYLALKDSALDTAATGTVYKLMRPVGSKVEDIVINSLPVSATQIQLGTANVNIYVPDLKTKSETLPDTARMEILTNLATTILDEVYAANSQNYNFQLANIATIEEPETGQHYVNLRIDFQFFPSI